MAAFNTGVPDTKEKLVSDINEKILLCSICMEKFESPKVLPCFHTYCELCLTEWVKKNKGNLICPTCKQSWPMTSDGVPGITNNRCINDLLELVQDVGSDTVTQICDACDKEAKYWCKDCGEFFCDDCSRVHRKIRVTRDHRLMTIVDYNEQASTNYLNVLQPQFCSDHTTEKLKFFCDTCQVPACMECAEVKHVAPEHKMISVEEALEKYEPKMQEYAGKVAQDVAELKQAKVKGEQLDKGLKQKKTVADDQVNLVIQKIEVETKKHKSRLRRDIDDIYVTKHEQITMHIELLDKKLASAKRTHAYLTHLLTYGSPVDIMAAKKELDQQFMDAKHREMSGIDNLDNNLVFTENPQCLQIDPGTVGTKKTDDTGNSMTGNGGHHSGTVVGDQHDREREMSRLPIDEDVAIIKFVCSMHEDVVEEISSKYHVEIVLTTEKDGEAAICVGSSAEEVQAAKDEFQSFVRILTPTMTVKSIDFTNQRNFDREKKNNVEKILKVYEKKLVYTKSGRKYTLVCDDKKILDKVLQLVNHACNTPIKASPSADMSKQATIGDDMLAYMFHVYKEKLAKYEDKHNVIFERKGTDDILISPARGVDNPKQEHMDAAYESFVTFVQSLHARMDSKDVDFSSRAILAQDISRARDEVHTQYKKVFIKEVGSKKFKVMGDADDIKPAMHAFCKQLGVTLAKSYGGTYVGLQRSYSIPDDQPSGKPANLLEFEVLGKKVVIFKGDITKEKVDGISNDANSRLEHGGGIAGAMVRAGGYSIQQDSKDILKSIKRYLKLSEVVYTKAGRLPCKWVLHVVGPQWSGYNEAQVKTALYNCFMNLIIEAKGLGMKSIAIPAIGTGLFGVPKQLCAEVMKDALFAYLYNENFTDYMKEIHFIDADCETVETYIRVFEGYLKEFKIPYQKN